MADLIDRQAALDALAKQMPKTYTPDGSHPADEEIYKIQEIYVDCIESIEILPAVQPEPCEDAISRRAAIDAVIDELKRSPTPAIRAKFRLEALPSAQPETYWIPCSERLPEEGQKCLVCDKGGIGIDTYTGHGNPYNWKWYTRDYDAWMPLPAPYKGGDSD